LAGKVEWKLEEDDCIEKYYLVKSDAELANYLKKTESQVRTRRYELGFIKQRQIQHIGEKKDGMKWCWYCTEYHEISQFNKNKRREDGLQDECKRANKETTLKRKAMKNKKKEDGILEKRCIKCDKLKSVDNFIKNISTTDGYSNLCKECLNENKILRKFKITEEL